MGRMLQKSVLSRKLAQRRSDRLVNDSAPIMTGVVNPKSSVNKDESKFQPPGTTGFQFDPDDDDSVNSNGRQYSVYRSCGIPCGDCNRTWSERPRHCDFYGMKYHGPNAEIPMKTSIRLFDILLHPLRSWMKYISR